MEKTKVYCQAMHNFYLDLFQIKISVMKEHEATIDLSQLTPGKVAIIKGFDEENIPVKLLEMGFLPGSHVMVRGLSLFGDPMHVTVGGTDVAIRKDEASYIQLYAPNDKPVLE